MVTQCKLNVIKRYITDNPFLIVYMFNLEMCYNVGMNPDRNNPPNRNRDNKPDDNDDPFGFRPRSRRPLPELGPGEE